MEEWDSRRVGVGRERLRRRSSCWSSLLRRPMDSHEGRRAAYRRRSGNMHDGVDVRRQDQRASDRHRPWSSPSDAAAQREGLSPPAEPRRMPSRGDGQQGAAGSDVRANRRERDAGRSTARMEAAPDESDANGDANAPSKRARKRRLLAETPEHLPGEPAFEEMHASWRPRRLEKATAAALAKKALRPAEELNRRERRQGVAVAEFGAKHTHFIGPECVPVSHTVYLAAAEASWRAEAEAAARAAEAAEAARVAQEKEEVERQRRRLRDRARRRRRRADSWDDDDDDDDIFGELDEASGVA